MNLEEVRLNIDRVDKEIKKLFKERMLLADQVATVKAQTEDVIYKPDREEIIISKLTEDIDDNIKKEYIALIKRIMEISRKYQYGKTLKLRDCLDIKYQTEDKEIKKLAMVKTELEANGKYPQNMICPVACVDDMAILMADKSVDGGLGILEDVSYGVSDEMHHLLTRNHLYINNCDVINIDGHRKKVALISDKMVVKEEHNRLKLMFVCSNRSGSLASCLSMISDYGVNLTEIHSVPNRECQWNYNFYVELNANFLKEEIQALVFQLQSETEVFQILGSYYCEGDFDE